MKKWLSLILVGVLALTFTSVAFAEEEYEGTLRMMGPGLFADVGEDGVTDLVSGLEKPGYSELIALFNAEYPNVKVEIEAIPWDSWQAKVQAAVAGEQVDLVLHGATTTEVVMDLTEYLAGDPELAAVLTATDPRRTDESNYDKLAIIGIPYTVGIYYAVLDTKIFEHYGVEVPTAEWTWDDLLAIAQQLTGTDPVTGTQTYGVKPFVSNDSSIWKSYMSYCFAKGIENFTMAPNKFDVTFNFTTEAGISAFQFMKDLIDCTPAGYLEGAGGELFGQEGNDVAICLAEGPEGMYRNLVAYGTADEYVFLPLPVQETGVAATSGVPGDNNMAIAVNAARPDLAWLFIRWINTSEEAQDWILRCGVTPCSTIGQAKMDESAPYREAVLKTMEGYPDNFYYAGGPYWDNSYGNSNSVLCSNLASLFSGSITAEECAQNVQAGLEEWQSLNG